MHCIINIITLLFCLFHINCSFAVAKKKYVPPQASLIVNADTGKILHSSNAKIKIHPASLTKMMTLYLTFEALEQGKIDINDNIKISKYAIDVPHSKLSLKEKDSIKLRKAILSLIIKSANDSARVLAEHVGKSEKKFANLMNIKARKLGMRNTNFVNASGLHHNRQYSTALDMYKLAVALKQDFPKYYHLFSKTSFVFQGKTYNTTNNVLLTYSIAEGLKTGYIAKAGYNLVTTASKDNKNLVGVVIGGKSAQERDSKMISLMDKFFNNTKRLASQQTKRKSV